MAPKSRSRWQKVGEFLIWGALIVLLGGIIANRFGLMNWTVIYRWTGFSTKTGWDWLQLLIIPTMLAIGGFWLNQVQKRREERITQEQKEVEQEVATDNQRESSLHTYIDKMSELLVEKQLRDSEEDDERREIARIRTLTVLSRLDGSRKRIVLQFLHEAGLIDKDKHIIDLHGANLRGAKLSEANLFGADLSGVDMRKANLRGVDMRKVNLCRADLGGTDLGGAKLSEANLFGADLRGAYLGNIDLSGATLDEATLSEDDLHHATFSDATLRGTDLRGADLRGAKLRGADLSGADLSGAILDGADLDDAWVANELEASAKDEVSKKLPELPNADAKYARYRSATGRHGPLRPFGWPLHIPCGVTYTSDEYTVMYIHPSRYVLIIKLILPFLLLLDTIITAIFIPSLITWIAIAIFVILFWMVVYIINYIDDVFILTTKRIIDIERKYIFFFEEHLMTQYWQIKNIRVKIRNPIFLALDVGDVIVETLGEAPDLSLTHIDHPFFLLDKIFQIKDTMEKKEERKR